jgi:Zn-dependent protease
MSDLGRMSLNELGDLLLSWIALVVGFSIVFERRMPSLEAIAIIAVGVGTGFLLHELAHKFVAQRYGYWAEYQANKTGLLFIIVMALAGFIFAAPGAVVIHKMSYAVPSSPHLYGSPYGAEVSWDREKDRKDELHISLAGPMINIILALISLASVLSGMVTEGLAFGIAYFTFFINLNLAAFNLLPFGPLDGRKVYESSPVIWAIVAIPTILIGGAVLFFGARII